MEAKPTGIKQNPNQTKTTHPKKQQPTKRCPFFGGIGQGFTFAPKSGEQKLFQAWLRGQQERKRNSTPGKASSVVQNMQNKNSLPPSLQEMIDDLLQIMNPHISSQ